MKDWECSSLTSHYRRITVSNHSPGVSKICPAVVKEAKKQWKARTKLLIRVVDLPQIL